jgi:hypothetical protein
MSCIAHASVLTDMGDFDPDQAWRQLPTSVNRFALLQVDPCLQIGPRIPWRHISQVTA